MGAEMNRLTEDELFEVQEDQMKLALEKFFDNILDCLVINDFELVK